MRKMKQVIVAMLLATTAFGAQAESKVQACYEKAQSAREKAVCLKAEMKVVEKEYNDVIERVTVKAKSLDRKKKKQTAMQALTRANKRFDEYVKSECKWYAVSRGIVAKSSNVELSCRINMLRVRTSNLEYQYLNDDN